MIFCACLIIERDGKILLVRVRDNVLWYLPGGTIEPGETAQEALVREVSEELGVSLIPETIEFCHRITGPAYGRAGEVELTCFRARWSGDISARAEISALDWFGPGDEAQVAPAIRLLFRQLWPVAA